MPFLLASVLVLIIISTRPFPYLITHQLEKQYPALSVSDIPSSDTAKPYYIIVLGAGFSDDGKLSPIDRISRQTLGRLAEAIRIYRILPGSKIVTSGGSFRLSESQASAVSGAALALGVLPNDIVKLESAKNTREEAEEYFKLIGEKERIILVTDAIHMQRSMKLFHELGLKPCAAPTNHYIKSNTKKSPLNWLPSYENIEITEAAMHEYGGLVEIWLKSQKKNRKYTK